MLLKGTYSAEDAENFKGCSVGCHLHHIFPDADATEIGDMSEKHFKVAKYYGYPEWLALLQDTVFEGLPSGDPALDGIIDLAEISGSETFVHLKRGSLPLVAQLPGVHDMNIGSESTMHFQPGDLFIFSADGALIYAPGV